MANYTTSTSDKSKKKAIRKLLFGGLGMHLFYVGRIKSGIIRFILGVLCWVLIVDGIIERLPEMILSGILFLVVINIVDLVKLFLGTFRDNVGNALRD
ncbi:NINE protein [uncultured Flavonifractor sp.]|uniref:NINE protein n=1 Tax=uncultured Flavonifractor sp. TaxID=1193534 RepID=UPI002629733D|nr:NINE protein [uncultured Flavonifractor sp.]